MKTAFILLASLALLVQFAFAPLSSIQDEPPKVSLQFENAEVRVVLRSLFQQAGLGCTVSKEVDGKVTVSVKDVPFEMALRQVLMQVDATYKVEKGLYEVMSRQYGLQSRGPISAVAQDEQFLYVAQSDYILKIKKSGLKIVGETHMPRDMTIGIP